MHTNKPDTKLYNFCKATRDEMEMLSCTLVFGSFFTLTLWGVFALATKTLERWS